MAADGYTQTERAIEKIQALFKQYEMGAITPRELWTNIAVIAGDRLAGRKR